MNEVIERVKIMGRYVFQTSSKYIFGIAGPSSAAMEMAITNLLWKDKKVLVFKNGTFSGRFGEMAEGVGAVCNIIEPEGFKPITAQIVRELFKKEQYDAITIVQGETSCGVVNNELPEIAKIAKENGALVIVDAVCTLTAMPLYMDEWELDVVVVGGQKGLSSIPGVSLIAFSDAAWNIIENRDVKCPHWCLDAKRAINFWQDHNYHYTAPVPGILALHEALRLISLETLEMRFERHLLSSNALQAGIEAMGLELFIPEPYRLNSVLAITLPDKADGAAVRNYMTNNFNVEISGAYGLPVIRIGQMGEQCRSHNLFRVLYAMGRGFNHIGVNVDLAAGMAKLEESLENTKNVL
jgi:aspartate aminotransferase-like enzyme